MADSLSERVGLGKERVQTVRTVLSVLVGVLSPKAQDNLSFSIKKILLKLFT